MRFGDRRMKEREMGGVAMCTAQCFDGGGCCMLSLLLHLICVFIGKQSLSDCWIGLALILFRRQSVGA